MHSSNEVEGLGGCGQFGPGPKAVKPGQDGPFFHVRIRELQAVPNTR